MSERQEYWYEMGAVVLIMIGMMNCFMYALNGITWLVTKV